MNERLTDNLLSGIYIFFCFSSLNWSEHRLFSAFNRELQETTMLTIISKLFSETICDVVKLSSNSKSNRYRLHSTKFPLMINARDRVSVLLTSNSRDSSLQYQIVIDSNGNILLYKKAGEQSEKLTESNVTAPLLKENETRIFWIDIEEDRVVFGSGEKVGYKNIWFASPNLYFQPT